MKKKSILLAIIGVLLALAGVIIKLNNYGGEILFIFAGAFILMFLVTLVCKKKKIVFSFGVIAVYMAIIFQYLIFNSFYSIGTITMILFMAGMILILYGIISSKLENKKVS